MSTVSERLFAQIKLQQEREAAYVAAQTSLSAATRDRNAAKELRDRSEEQFAEGAALQKALEKKRQENALEIQALALRHENDRKELMKALEERVGSVNARVEATSVRKAKAEHENSRLKEQIGILEAHKESGTDKFTELMAARDKEVGSFSSQIEKEEKITELLERQNAMTKTQIEKLTVIHDTLKEKVEVYVGKFSAFQDQLKAARAIFDESQKTRERLARRLNTSKEERELARLRSVKARKEYEAEEAKVAAAEKHVAGLEAQITVLQQLLETIAKGGAVPAPSAAAETATEAEAEDKPSPAAKLD